MADFSLYSRMLAHGTLSEDPRDIPDPRFALSGTVNWMRALAILTKTSAMSFGTARSNFQNVNRRSFSDPELNSIFEQLLFSMHQIASLRALSGVENKADVSRMAIVAWYYAIYGAASAMLTATDGSFADNHASTAAQWDRQIAENNLVMAPFAARISKITDDVIKREVETVRALGKFSLTNVPQTAEQAWGCIAEYLAGTAS